MAIDVKFSVGVVIGALLVFVYYKWCESKMKG
jgi:hypothetical protein